VKPRDEGGGGDGTELRPIRPLAFQPQLRAGEGEEVVGTRASLQDPPEVAGVLQSTAPRQQGHEVDQHPHRARTGSAGTSTSGSGSSWSPAVQPAGKITLAVA